MIAFILLKESDSNHIPSKIRFLSIVLLLTHTTSCCRGRYLLQCRPGAWDEGEPLLLLLRFLLLLSPMP